MSEKVLQEFTIDTSAGIRATDALTSAFKIHSQAILDTGKAYQVLEGSAQKSQNSFGSYEKGIRAATNVLAQLQIEARKTEQALNAQIVATNATAFSIGRLNASLRSFSAAGAIRELKRLTDATNAYSRAKREAAGATDTPFHQERFLAIKGRTGATPNLALPNYAQASTYPQGFRQDEINAPAILKRRFALIEETKRDQARATREASRQAQAQVAQHAAFAQGNFGQGNIPGGDFLRQAGGGILKGGVQGQLFSEQFRRDALRDAAKLSVQIGRIFKEQQKQLGFDRGETRLGIGPSQLALPSPAAVRLSPQGEHQNRVNQAAAQHQAAADARLQAKAYNEAIQDSFARFATGKTGFAHTVLNAEPPPITPKGGPGRFVDPEKGGLPATIQRDSPFQFKSGFKPRLDQLVNLKDVLAAQNAVKSLDAQFGKLKGTIDQIGGIAFATAIYRAISALTQAVEQSIHSAAEYARKIGLLQTLSRDSGESFDTWSTAVANLSTELGAPAIEIAQAAYDGLSNQVINTTRDFGLLETSFKLARATGSDVTNSLNLLSSVIRGFGTTTGDAEKIANSFFVTVDIGRVKLDELNQSYGRSANLANTLGVSYQELNAGIALITQTGVKATESTTLLNNIFVQLLHPNEALKELFHELGFETGVAAQSALGFAGTLDAIVKASKKTKEGLATFFPEIRGLRGVSALNTFGLEEYNKTLKKVTESTKAVADASKILEENVGFKFQKELENIKTFFTTDIGQSFLNLVIDISDKFGGLSSVVKIATGELLLFGGTFLLFKSAAGLAGIIKAFSDIGSFAYKISTGLETAKIATGLFAGTSIAAAAPVIAAFVAIAAAVGAIAYAYHRIIEARKETFKGGADEFKKAIDKNQVDQKAAIDRQTADFEAGLKKQTGLYTTYIAGLRTKNNALIDEFKKTHDKIAESLQNTFDILLGAAGKNVTQLRDAQHAAIDNIKNLQEEAIRSKDEAEKDAYTRSIERLKNLDEFERGRGKAGRGNDLAATVGARNAVLSGKQQKAFDTGNYTEAAKLQDEIRQNLSRIANETITVNGLTRQRFNVEQSELGFATQYLQRIEARKAIEAQIGETKRVQANAAEKQTKELEDVLRHTQKFSILDAQGNVIDKYKKDLRLAFVDLDKSQVKAVELIKTMKGLNDPALALTYNEIVAEVEKAFNAQRKNTTELVTGLEKANSLNKAERDRNTQADLLLSTNTQIRQSLEDQLKIIKEQGTDIGGLVATLNQGTTFVQNVGNILNNVGALSGNPQVVIDKLKEAKLILADIRKQTTASAPDFAQLATDANKLILAIQPIKDFQIPINAKGEMDSVENVVDKLYTDIKKFNAAGQQTVTLQSQLKQTQDIQDALLRDAQNLSNAGDALEKVGTGQRSITANTSGLDANAAAMRAIASATAAAASAQAQLNEQVTTGSGRIGQVKGGQVESKAAGGRAGSAGGFLADFYGGRFAVGSDVIPTMLKRGEMVVRDPFAQQFYSQLVAMNAGIAPKGDTDERQTYNIPITVNVQGSKANPKEIARAIRRDLRRRITKL